MFRVNLFLVDNTTCGYDIAYAINALDACRQSLIIFGQHHQANELLAVEVWS